MNVRISRLLLLASSGLLAACSTVPRQVAAPAPAPVQAPAPVPVQILAINDFHGALEPPKLAVTAKDASGQEIEVPAGGAAYLAGAAKALREGQTNTVTVSAGDMIGATPLPSALFLDEPAVNAMDLVGVEFNAVGNHEFDKGSAELVRMQTGGCEKHTDRQPCRLEPFDGASFRFLAANVIRSDGTTLFPGTGVKDFGAVQVGFIGMTLKETATLVSPGGVKGLTFADEAATANAAVPSLKAAGADALVLLIHQGVRTKGAYNDKSCPGLSGDLVPILDRLDPAISVVISGHTHAAYVCTYKKPDGSSVLLTSAGRSGIMITDIRLAVTPGGGVVVNGADNIIVQGEGFSLPARTVPVHAEFRRFEADPATATFVSRYVAASEVEAKRPVGRLLGGAALRAEDANGEQVAGNFIADAQLAATRKNGAQVAFINSGGVRTDLAPAADGTVTYGQIFAMQPFGNSLVTKTLTGAQLKKLLEQQFNSGSNTAERPNMLLPSRGFFFAYDLRRPGGDRIVDMRLNGKRIDPAADYRVTVNNFMASGGDNFTVLANGRDATEGGPDLEALEAYLKAGARLPGTGRIRKAG